LAKPPFVRLFDEAQSGFGVGRRSLLLLHSLNVKTAKAPGLTIAPALVC
jgi:hypothetical protein